MGTKAWGDPSRERRTADRSVPMLVHNTVQMAKTQTFPSTALTYGLGMGVVSVGRLILDILETTKYVLSVSTSIPLPLTSSASAALKDARNAFEAAYGASIGEMIVTPANDALDKIRPRFLVRNERCSSPDNADDRPLDHTRKNCTSGIHRCIHVDSKNAVELIFRHVD